MRTTRVLILLLVAVPAVIAACGPAAFPGGEQPPSAGALVADSLEALARQQEASARFELSAEAKPSLRGRAAMMVGKLLMIEIEGAASGSALVARGKVEDGIGQSFEGEIRAGDNGFYLRVGDEWYGAPDSGPTGGAFTFERPSGSELSELTAALRAAGDELFDGAVKGGPEVRGDDTWQLDGTINPDAAVEIGRRTGRPLTAAEEASLRSEVENVRIEYAVGRDDHLPRRIAVSGGIAIAGMPIEVKDGFPLEGLEVDLELELSGWGAPVSVEAPERYTSFGELFGSFLSGSRIDVSPPGIPAPAGPPPEVEIPEIPPPGAVPPPSAVPPSSVPPPHVVPPPPVVPPHSAVPPPPVGAPGVSSP